MPIKNKLSLLYVRIVKNQMANSSKQQQKLTEKAAYK